MDEKIKENTQQLSDAQTAARNKQIEHDTFQESVQLLKKDIELVQERAVLIEKLEELHLQLDWSLLREQEKKVEDTEMTLKSLVRLKEDLTNHIYTEKEKLSNAQNGLQKVEREEARLSQKLHEMLLSCKKMENSISLKEAEAHGLQKRKEQKIAESVSAERLFLSLEEKIKSIKKTSQEKKQREEVRILDLIRLHKSSIAVIVNELNEIDSQMMNLKKNISEKKEEKSKLAYELENLHNTYRKLSEMHNRSSSNVTKFAPFPLWTAKLDALIDQSYKNGVFHERPIGPIGSVLTLKDYNWALAVEACLKQSLFQYCVCDHHDKGELLKLMSKFCDRFKLPSLVILPFRKSLYDTRGNRPAVNFPTVMDILNCDYPQVINMLIDTVTIERIICFKDSKTAQDIMLNRPPRNVVKAFTIEGDEYLVSKYHNSSRFYSATLRKPRVFIEDIAAELRDLKEKLENNKKDEQKLRLKITAVSDSLDSLNENLVTLVRKQSEKKSEMNGFDSSITELNVQLKRVQVKSNVSELECERDEISKNLENLLKEKNECESQIQHLLAVIKTTKEEINELKGETVSLKEQIAECTKTSMSFSMQIKHSKEFETKNEEELSNINSLIGVERAKFEEMRNNSIKVRSNLLSKGPEIPLDENNTSDSLRRDISVLEHRLSQTKDDLTQEKLDEMRYRYERDNQKLLEVSSSVTKLSEVIAKLSEDLPNRIEKYESLRASVTARISKNFMRILTYRGFTGSLDIDHNARSLKVHVQKAVGDTSTLHDLKGLSGGERSFATLALIISIWEDMDSPFRCMDEFDVFMDSVNRTVCFGLLRDYTNNNSKNQVIILTPQDIKGVSLPEESSILKIN